MRKNIAETLKAFHSFKIAKPSVSIATDGNSIFSYDTCIVTRDGDFFIVNCSQYSKTTSQQQNAILSDLPRFFVIKVYGLYHGATPEELKNKARIAIQESISGVTLSAEAYAKACNIPLPANV
jgi:hypothetical protein